MYGNPDEEMKGGGDASRLATVSPLWRLDNGPAVGRKGYVTRNALGA
jgi:hypothetical protein